MHPPPISLRTPGFAHYSLSWSPFHKARIGVASSANYGLVGNGRLHIASFDGQNLNLDKFFDTQDALYDVAWSEVHENQIAVASGDGSIKLFDVLLNDLPVRIWREHTREVFSLDWSNLRKEQFASSSWDGHIKLWRPEMPRSVETILAHPACVYQALFSPHEPDILASCSTDGTVRLFDLRTPIVGSMSHTNPLTPPIFTIPAGAGEILTIDWNKYLPWTIASAGVDKVIKVWDCRMVKSQDGGNEVGGVCLADFAGHEYAIRKVNWSPHRRDVLASASYDMSCRVWLTEPPSGAPSLAHIHDAHTEFVSGCMWSLFDPGMLASCSWDFRVNIYRGF